MANRTISGANWIHGRDPQHLIEKIIRERVYDSMYWKEECFGLTAVTLMDKAVELNSIGGEYGSQIPTHFLCLTLKMLQLQPEREILTDLIKQEEFKYLRALAAFYLRIVGQSKEIYQYLEPLLNDYRKLRVRVGSGYTLSHMDEFIDQLLHQDRVCDVILPRLVQRHVLEDNDELEPRVSALEEDLESEEDTKQQDNDDDNDNNDNHKQRQHSSSPERSSRRYHSDDSASDHEDRHERRQRHDRHRDDDSRDRSERRRYRDDSRDRSYSRHGRRRDDSRDRSPSRRRDDSGDRSSSKHRSSRHRSRYRSPSPSRSRSSEDRYRHRR